MYILWCLYAGLLYPPISIVFEMTPACLLRSEHQLFAFSVGSRSDSRFESEQCNNCVIILSL